MLFFKKRAKKEAKPTRAFPSSVKKTVWYAQDEQCNTCHAKLDLRTVNYDHIVRYADGGANDIANCQALCPNCHAMKTFHDNKKGGDRQ